MRRTYDRLVGPVAIRERAPHPSLAALGTTSTRSLVPIDLRRWRVVRGRTSTADLRRELAEHAGANDSDIEPLVARFGLSFGGGPAVEAERAAQLMKAVRDGLAGRPDAPLREPLIIYPEGEDPRPMWKTHVDPDLFERDNRDHLADALAWSLRTLAARTSSAEWQKRAQVAARAWRPAGGAVRLHRLSADQAGREPRLAGDDWVPIFAFAVVRASTKVRDTRSLWHALIAVGPLLLAMAEANVSPAERVPSGIQLLVETPARWRAITLEAERWMTALDELAFVEEELATERRSTDDEGADRYTDLRAALAALRDSLQPDLELYQRLHHLEASDTEGARSALDAVLEERLSAVGVGPDTPAGTLIGLEGAMLLSVRAGFAGGRCVECGRRTAGRRHRCKEHQRAIWRQRKRTQRRPARSGRRPTR